MMTTPTLQEAMRYAEAGEYDILPVSCELLSDAFTPIGVLRILKHVSAHTYLLESVTSWNSTAGIHFSATIPSPRSAAWTAH